jgi:hypothetical protein
MNWQLLMSWIGALKHLDQTFAAALVDLMQAASVINDVWNMK